MGLSLADVRGIADYARIALSEDELTQMCAYMNDVVDNVLDVICSYDLEGVEPVFHPIGDLSNVMRDDVVEPGLSCEEALANAGQSEGRFFRVPAILSDGGAA